MKNLCFCLILGLCTAFSCSKPPLEKPRHLIPEDKMASMIADFAINDQLGIINAEGDLEVGSKYILKIHNVSGKNFLESYAYYTSQPDLLEKIFNTAQENIKKQDPNASNYIETEQKKHSPFLQESSEN
ncbi:MAG: DUF4296 domain-containing protein [Bergeyella sp.]|nr:DUF4296 domain-containing protein [Bergeyella sp.]